MSAFETPSPTTATQTVRKRRWWLVVLIWLGISALSVMLVGAAIYGIFLWNAKQDLAAEIAHVRASGAPLTSVELNEQFQPEPGKRDITSELIAALANVEDPELMTAARPLPYVGGGEKPAADAEEWPQLEEAKAFLSRYLELFQFLESIEGHEVTVRFPTDLSLGLLAKQQHQIQLVQAVRILRLQLRVDWFEQRRERIVKLLLQQIVLANFLEYDPTATCQLIRLAMFEMVRQDLEWAIGELELPDADWLRLQMAMRSLNGLKSLALVLDGERAIDYTTSTWPLTEDEWISNREFVDNNLAAGPKRPWDCALLLAYFRRLEQAADQSYYAILQENQLVIHELRDLLNSRKRRFYVYTALMTPPLSSSINFSARQAARNAATDAGIAAIRYRLAHKAWPAQLADLVPLCLPDVPIDPFTDKPLLIVVTDGESKVYSVGQNGIDDGGVWDEEDFADVGFAVPVK